MSNIHPSAVVHPAATIDEEVEIGPYAVIDEHVSIGKGTRVLAMAHITGYTTIGQYNVIHAGAVIGGDPQDVNFKGEPSYLAIGDRNVFRENVTVHRGTAPGSSTIIGDNNLFMVNAHIAHNNVVGNHAIFVNNSCLAGHVDVEDRAHIGAYCSVHQFCRVGKHAFMRGYSRASRDVPPYCIIENLHTVRALNTIGLKRAGFSPERVNSLKQAFRILFRLSGNLKLAAERVEREVEMTPDVQHLLDFIRSSKKGVAVGKIDAPEILEEE